MKSKKGLNTKFKTKKSFELEYKRIMKEFPSTNQQWSGAGDAFSKFSLDRQEQTIALPYTSL